MKSCKHILIIFTFTLTNLFIWSSSGYGYGDEKKACNTLSGVETIDVVFDWDGRGMKMSEYVSTRDILEAFVVQKLREKGINVREVYSCEAIDIIKKNPFLYVEMHTYKCSEDEHTVYLDVKYFQEVSIKDNPSKSFISPTWSAGGAIRIVPITSFSDLLSEMLEKFVSAYKSVNPQIVAEGDRSDRKAYHGGGTS